MLPRFAATVCSTSIGIIAEEQPVCESSGSVNGTKTMSATSFVTSIEQKNGSSTSVMLRTRPLSPRLSITYVSRRNAPHA